MKARHEIIAVCAEEKHKEIKSIKDEVGDGGTQEDRSRAEMENRHMRKESAQETYS